MAVKHFRNRLEQALKTHLGDQAAGATAAVQAMTFNIRSDGTSADVRPLCNIACLSATQINTLGGYYRCEIELDLLSALDNGQMESHNERVAWIEEQLFDHPTLLTGLNTADDITVLSAYLDSETAEESDNDLEDQVTLVLIAHPF